MYPKIIHKYLYNALYIIKNTNHTPLKGGRNTTKIEWHVSISENSKGVSELHLFLVFRGNKNLIIT